MIRDADSLFVHRCIWVPREFLSNRPEGRQTPQLSILSAEVVDAPGTTGLRDGQPTTSHVRMRSDYERIGVEE